MNPMSWPFALLLAAVVVMILEIFIPSGGVLAVLSGLAFFASIVAAFFYGGLELGTYFLAGTSLLIPVIVYASIKLWPKTPIGRRILNRVQGGDAILPTELIQRKRWLGRRGIAKTSMLPSGVIRIEGKTLDAISDGMTIERGTAIEVFAIRGNHLVVRPVRDQSTDPELTQDDGGKLPKPASPLDEVIQDPFDDSLS